MTIAKPPLSRLLICGLGNPGRKYVHTRHSIGHLLLDALRSQWHYPEWRHDMKTHGYWSGEAEKCVLFKPDVMMNSSGKAVSAAYRKMGLREKGRVVVIHDDLELPVGAVKLRKKGGSVPYRHPNPPSFRSLTGSGHHGIESCAEYFQTDHFVQLAVGIGRPAMRDSGVVTAYVLSGFDYGEWDKIMKEAFPAIPELIKEFGDFKH